MNESYVDQLRAVSDHIEQHGASELLALDMSQQNVRLNVSGTGDDSGLAVFLRWAETLTGAVEFTAERRDKTLHVHALGALPGNGFPVVMVAVMFASDDGFDALAEEIGDRTGDVPLTRTQLAKIADPELLPDRESVTP